MTKYICQQCKKEFYDHKSDKSKYCSQECYWSSKKGKLAFPGCQFKPGHIPWNKDKIFVIKKPKPPRVHRRGFKRTAEAIRKQAERNRGSKRTIETKLKMSKAQSGSNNPSWRGGLSLSKYTFGWSRRLKEDIRKRDGYKCQLCGVPQIECLRKLHIHHINYNKCDLKENNLISLCHSCHMKTNHGNRTNWEYCLNNKIQSLKGKRQQSTRKG